MTEVQKYSIPQMKGVEIKMRNMLSKPWPVQIREDIAFCLFFVKLRIALSELEAGIEIGNAITDIEELVQVGFGAEK